MGKRAFKLGVARKAHDARHNAEVGRGIVSSHPLDHRPAVLFPVCVQILQKGLAEFIASATWASADASMTGSISSISVAPGV